MKERGQLGASLEIQGGDGNTGGVRERRTHSSDCSGGVLPVLLPGVNQLTLALSSRSPAGAQGNPLRILSTSSVA